MKKSIFILAAVAISAVASAQISVGGQVGVNLGMGQSGGSYFGSSLTNNPKVGIVIGVLADLPLGEKLAIRPEFNFIQKGNKFGGYAVLGGSSASRKISLNYLELPVNVVYKMSIGSSSNTLYFGLGPAVALGIIGTQKEPGEKVDIKFDGKADRVDGKEHLKRTDIGINILAGYQLKMGAFAKIGYTHGLPNIDPDNRQTYKNRGISICIGYMVGSKKK